MELFGTDGIRFLTVQDKNKELVYSPFFISRIGYAAARVLKKGKYILVWDTRKSSHHISYTFSAVLSSFGFETLLGGVLPTPSVSALIISLGLSGGFSVSASHNPPEFNGIKFFLENGLKADEDTEAKIESEFSKFSEDKITCQISHIRNFEDVAYSAYVSFIKNLFPKGFLRGLKIVLDCSNGATYKVAPHIFSSFLADIELVGCNPDGENINVGVGSENPNAALRKSGDFKLIFDGDGDRILIGDSKGNLYDGDHIISLLARFMKDEGKLKGAVVGTILSNKALEDFVKNKLGARFERVNVGDRNIAYKMREIGSNIGGEESGHIILSDIVPTGDGIIVGLQTLFYILKSGKDLSDLVIKKYYQAKGKIDVPKKEDLGSEKFSFLHKIFSDIERAGGRAVVRYSGTEPVLRVMVEHADESFAERYKDIIIGELSPIFRNQA